MYLLWIEQVFPQIYMLQWPQIYMLKLSSQYECLEVGCLGSDLVTRVKPT